jgi:flagellar biosynthetic protein FlhB
VAESSAQDRTEEATPRRKREARERGQVPRSRELSTAAVVGAAVLILTVAGSHVAAAALSFMRGALQVDAAMLVDPTQVAVIAGRQMRRGLTVVAPLLGGTVIAALAAPALLGGWNISVRALQPDFSRVNPARGLGRILSVQGLFELSKSIMKFALLGAIGAFFIWHHRAELSELGLEAADAGAGHLARLVVGCLGWMTLGLVLIASVDAPYQRWNYLKQLRMTKQEIRDEYKQSEGRPEVKAKIRRIQHEMARRRMMEKVPTADVVVTNPTHYAVALKYTAGTMRAPVVVAKGVDVLAAAIRELAEQNRVPLVAAPPLARALYREVDLDAEIPVPLYAAVAQVLTYVYQLRNWNGGLKPKVPEIGDVPGGEPDAE